MSSLPSSRLVEPRPPRHRRPSPASPLAAGRRHRARLLPALLPGLVLALFLAGCGEEAEPVGEVSLQPSEITLPYPQAREVELTWQPVLPIEPAGPVRVFVHLLDADGEVERTFDHPFPREWRPGQLVTYPVRLYQSMLAPPLPEGERTLVVGLHDADRRWPLEGGEDRGRHAYRLGTVRVPAPELADLPQLTFVGGWGPLEAGGDRQVLGSRWIGGEGAIQIRDVAKPGLLALQFETPQVPAGVERIMEGAAEEPCLQVTSTCDGSEHSLSGTGLSRLQVEVPAGEPCEVRLQPNFRFDHPDHEGRAVRLLGVTWNPGEAG